jgi:hypothetical protein
MRLKAENDEYTEAPFQPTLETERGEAARRAHSKLRVVSEPETYLDRLRNEAKQRADAQRKEHEVRECESVRDVRPAAMAAASSRRRSRRRAGRRATETTRAASRQWLARCVAESRAVLFLEEEPTPASWQ